MNEASFDYYDQYKERKTYELLFPLPFHWLVKSRNVLKVFYFDNDKCHEAVDLPYNASPSISAKET